MNSLLVVALVFIGFFIAYHTYGRFLTKKIFAINPNMICPSEKLRDDEDYVPTNKFVLFGHHFASIAGLGPIVGPAIAIIWGWVPAVLWIFFGTIFIGAVHDLGSLIVSIRGNGRSIGDLAATIINPRVRTLFLLIIFFELWIVMAVFALIIAILFTMYPEAVLPTWLAIPIAVFLGHLIYKKKKDPALSGIIAALVLYATIILGAFVPFKMPALFGLNPLTIWIILLLIYVYVASTLPVQTLLQPRDYINSFQLLITMLLLTLGVIVARPQIVAPAIAASVKGAPPVLPILFITIACGAISGFHSLVSSGTSSKQCDNEKNVKFIGYGGMITEGALATLVVIAVSAGLGLGLVAKNGQQLTGIAAFNYHYSSWSAASGLSAKLSAFITGSANMIAAFGIPAKITIAIMGVFIVSFAATSLDSATRIQRYVIAELAGAWNIKPITGKHGATCVAIISVMILAFFQKGGKGALILWPLFGSVNQLLAGLALLVITIYLAKRKVNIIYTTVPMGFMILMTGWAMVVNIWGFYTAANWLLLSIGLSVLILEIWMICESVLVIKKVYIKEG